MFYNLVEFATINSSINMKEYRCKNRGVSPRPAGSSQCNFRENLVRQLCGFEQFDSPPTPVAGWKRRCPDNAPAIAPALHLAKASLSRGNCVLCYHKEKKEMMTSFCCSKCKTEGRPLFLCIKEGHQCFFDYHQTI